MDPPNEGGTQLVVVTVPQDKHKILTFRNSFVNGEEIKTLDLHGTRPSAIRQITLQKLIFFSQESEFSKVHCCKNVNLKIRVK